MPWCSSRKASPGGAFFGPLWLLFNALWLRVRRRSASGGGPRGRLGWGRAQRPGSEYRVPPAHVDNRLRGTMACCDGGWNGRAIATSASVAGNSFEECERRFFDAWLPSVASQNAKAGTETRAGHLSELLGRLARAGRGRYTAKRDCVIAMLVAIVDYQSGNLHSAAKAFERAARESGIPAEISVTSDPAIVQRADRIVLPGVARFRRLLSGP